MDITKYSTSIKTWINLKSQNKRNFKVSTKNLCW